MDTPKIRPLADRILVTRVKREEKTPGGIIIPDSVDNREPAVEVDVVAVGKDVKEKLAQGVRIIVSKYSGTDLTVSGESVLMVREDDVLGVVEQQS